MRIKDRKNSGDFISLTAHSCITTKSAALTFTPLKKNHCCSFLIAEYQGNFFQASSTCKATLLKLR
jgi:hypothetical protein